MTKVWLIICGILFAVALYWSFVANYRQNKINNLETQINELNNNIKQCKQEKESCYDEILHYQTAQTNAADKIEKVRTIVRTIKSDCNCYDTRLPDDVLRLFNNK